MRVITSIVFVVLCVGPSAEDLVGVADVSAAIAETLRRSCFECHGSAKQEGGLRLDDGPAAHVGGDSGRPIVAGRPEESEMLRRVSLPRTDPEAMPPQGDAAPVLIPAGLSAMQGR